MGKKCQRRGRVPNPRKHAAEEAAQSRTSAAQACVEESQACAGAAEAEAAESAQTRAAAELCSCPTCRSRGGGPCCRRDTTPDQLSAPCRGSAVATQLSASSRGGAAPNPRKYGVAEPPSARTPQQTSVSYLSILLGTATVKDSAASSSSPRAVAETPPSKPSSPQAVAETPPSKPTIYVNKPPGWYFSIYIRIDHSKSFHTYPCLGGPFKSPDEVEKAIECYLDGKRHKTLWKEQCGDSEMEIVIKKALYWPDGRTRRCSDNQVVEHTREQKSLMLQAFLDTYNEKHKLFGDDAYELKDILHFQSIGEGNMWYKHFNFTTKTKDGIEDLFFAEVKEEGDNELVANTFCKIESNENGHCYGCINNGSIDIKHPDKADAYSGGHLDVYLPFGGGSRRPNTWTGSKEDVAREEARLRYIYGVK